MEGLGCRELRLRMPKSRVLQGSEIPLWGESPGEGEPPPPPPPLPPPPSPPLLPPLRRIAGATAGFFGSTSSWEAVRWEVEEGVAAGE